ncbi:similar to Ankyrin repeat domain protein 7 (Testis-specific protein TSA806) (predicted) [Rattus norvegicus]|uniref:Similar to Ankyrin repeat domain protein 7 (Testis-specific protein TSA806) (Predicted) n=1 Tax=Rattus norvegicus TaxID=10116 RepID=A6IE43_RAT|nr:similar to Ankyrin repeat domain protein 7 (Testis-specific protein TSA806) (predicted) [Rattus norvegicus]
MRKRRKLSKQLTEQFFLSLYIFFQEGKQPFPFKAVPNYGIKIFLSFKIINHVEDLH